MTHFLRQMTHNFLVVHFQMRGFEIHSLRLSTQFFLKYAIEQKKDGLE